MLSKKIVLGALFAATVSLAACGGKSKVKIDATDGITLDGTFQEAIEGYERADQLKAAAGLLILAYEGDDGDGPSDYIREATEEASFLIDPQGGNSVFQTRGSVMNDIARESNGILNGKTAQDLIDHYNISTKQYDEYLKDQEEAKAAEEAQREAEKAEKDARMAADKAEKAAQAAAAAEATRAKKVEAMKTELNAVLIQLPASGDANNAKRKQLKDAYDAAVAKRDKLAAQRTAMGGETTPGNTLSALSSDFQGQFEVTVINTTDAPIQNPIVQVEITPSDGKTITSRELKLYDVGDKNELMAPGGQKTMAYPGFAKFDKTSAISNVRGDFSGVDFKASVLGYQAADKSKVSLKLDKETKAIIDNYEAAVAQCDAADAAIAKAKTSIPASLKSLDAPDADVSKMSKIPTTRC